MLLELHEGGVQGNDFDDVEVSAPMVFGQGFTACVIAYVLCVCVHMCCRRRSISDMGKLKTKLNVDLSILEVQKDPRVCTTLKMPPIRMLKKRRIFGERLEKS